MPKLPSNNDQYNKLKPEQRLGDALVQQDYYDKMLITMQATDELFNGDTRAPNKQVGIVMLVFPFNDKGRCNYMSNGANRQDVVVLMKEMIARFEGQPEMEGHA